MKFLVDENIPRTVVNWLRENEYDVRYAAETNRQWSDRHLLNLAKREGRIVITDDKDFGSLTFFHHLPHVGVMLFRLRDSSSQVYITILQDILARYSEKLLGNFVVVSESQVRFRSMSSVISNDKWFGSTI